MAKKVTTKIGDIFKAKIGDNTVMYLQLIAFDKTQLNSDVIRVFDKHYPLEGETEIPDIINNEIAFFAHCVTKWGIQMGLWEKVGNSSEIGNVESIFFRSSGDNPKVEVSNNWWVWKINQPQISIGTLGEAYKSAEIGSVIPPDSIVSRMKYGKYDFVYPGYE